MKVHTFNKEYSGWYIDLPDYIAQGGSKGDLAMVAGADDMLDVLAEGGDRVTLSIDTKPFEGADELELIELCEPSIGGGYYLMQHYAGTEIKKRMWLCDVTLFVFGDMPSHIYVRKEESSPVL